MVAESTPRIGQLVLVLPDGGRVPVEDHMTIGRGEDATVRIEDPTVSRRHARIALRAGGAVIEDAGSRFGVLVDGHPLTGPRGLEPGAEIRLGNAVLRVEPAAPASSSGKPHSESRFDANATVVVPVGATRDGLRAAAAPADGSIRPRLRSGWALKRIADDPHDARYVLRDLRTNAFVRIDDEDAQLLRLLDGGRTIGELLAEATTLLGPTGAGRLARLIANLGDRGMLDGVAATPRVEAEPGLLRRVFTPREWTYEWIGDWFERVYAG
jgi:putative peptide zinc metalloprotease protein